MMTAYDLAEGQLWIVGVYDQTWETHIAAATLLFPSIDPYPKGKIVSLYTTYNMPRSVCLTGELECVGLISYKVLLMIDYWYE